MPNTAVGKISTIRWSSACAILMKRTTRSVLAIPALRNSGLDKIAWPNHTLLTVSIEILTLPGRSTNREDYQRVARPVAAMAKDFPSGFAIERHSHPRAQLIYAAQGVMRVTTPSGAWI